MTGEAFTLPKPVSPRQKGTEPAGEKQVLCHNMDRILIILNFNFSLFSISAVLKLREAGYEVVL